MEHFGVEPDLVTVAKSLAGGRPISGVLGRAEIMDAAGPSTIGGTFVGNPIACAAALAVLDVIEDEGLLARAAEIGGILRRRFEALKERSAAIGDVRGLGPMIGIEFAGADGAAAPDLAMAIVRKCMRNGLILLNAGVYGNVIRTLVPLVITDAQLAEALDVIEAAVVAVARG